LWVHIESARGATHEEVEFLETADAPLGGAGWNDEEIMDIAQVAAMFNFTNRLASGLGWVPNREYFSLGR